MDDRGRLYGLPGAEELHFDPAEVVEQWLDDNLDDSGCMAPFVIEEWSVHAPRYHMPSPSEVLEWLSEVVADSGELTEGAESGWDPAFDDGEVIAATDALLDLIATKVTWRQANEKLRELQVMPSDDPENPLLDGVPVWRSRPEVSR